MTLKQLIINYLSSKKEIKNKFTLTYEKRKTIFYLNIEDGFYKVTYRDKLDYKTLHLENITIDRLRKINSIK